MSNWTKGPWVSTCNWVHAASGGSICSLSGAISRKKKEAEANANLIAAAPELFDALKAVRDDLLMRAEKDSDGVGVVDLSHGAWLKLNEAIEKAEGRS